MNKKQRISNTLKKKTVRNVLTVIVAVTLSLALLVLSILMCIYMAPLINSQIMANYFVSVFSAAVGGSCTLVGVLITLRANSIIQKRTTKERNKPEIFIPGQFDSARAIRIRMVCDDNDLTNTPNHCFYLKNSDKAPFIIQSIRIGEVDFKAKTVSYIEKDNLFCISFHHKGIENKFILQIESMDGFSYTLNVTCEDDDVITITEDATK